MTDKQIIIDGVDVSGCEFYESNGMCSCSLVYYDYCKDFPNCVYKLSQQLKAKERECKELKAERDSWHYQWEKRYKIGECLSDKIDQLKQTLAEIKEIAEANKKYIYVLPSYFVAGDSLEFSFEFTKNILNKISECEVKDGNN